ncbi:hypothetical protein BVY01_03590 [bacterium I07]|nr:hypothetical protein BVY01_03590 [bacterium I07]
MKKFILFGLIAMTMAVQAQEIRFLSPKLVDLGRVLEGAVLSHTIQFVNSGEETVHLRQVGTTCGCTAAQTTRKDFAPGDTASIDVSINTRGFFGLMRKTVTLYFKEKEIKPQKIVFQVHPYTEVAVNPRYLYLQRIHLNPDTLITQTVKVSNQSKRSLHIKSVETDNPMVQVSPQKATITADKEQTFKISIRPETTGYKHIRIWMHTDYASKPKLEIPVFLHVRTRPAE